MSTDETYNGWKSRETWAVMLYVNNDQGLQDEALTLAKDAAESEQWDPSGREPRFILADTFAAWVEDLLSPSWWADEMGCPMPEGIELMRSDVGSLWRVDWVECADALLSDIADSEA